LKMWQSSNVWIWHLQNVIHEETESTLNSRNIWYVGTECHFFFMQLETYTVTVLPVTLCTCAVCSVTRR
jgi:hypothetical protein